MNLWEYIWAGATTTKWLRHLNGNSTDASWNGNNWTDTNITYWFAYGKFWQGALFNGSSSKIALAVASSNIATWTVCCWFKTSNKNTQMMWNYTQSGYIAWWQFFVAGTSWYLAFTHWRNTWITNNVDYKAFYWTTDMSDWKRHFWLATIDGDNVRIYVDGVLQSTTAWAYNIWYSANVRCNIWCNEYSPWSIVTWFNGSLDEVIVENVVRTPTQIKKYYTMTKWRFWII